jgi:PAS domain S-box-containing protein
MEGYAVVEVGDGRSALTAAAQRLPDLILQDLVLPDVTGLELLARLRALPGGAELPILALSGFAGQTEEARLALAGFTTILIKPVDPSRVVETVDAFLSRGPTAPVGGARRVLLVDDDPVQLKLTGIHLRELGFKVSTAASATEALRAAHKHVPDVIMTDVLMSDVDGFQLCFEVRRSPKLATVPVLLLSAYYQEGADQDLARRVGANALILRTHDLEGLGPAILQAVSDGAPAPIEEPSDSVKLAHAQGVVRQLERQVSVSAGLARRCTVQAAQLVLLGGIADALSRKSDFDLALRGVLAATVDAAAISKGVLFLSDATQGPPRVRHAIGFSEAEEDALADFFGHMPFLEGVIQRRAAVSIPSTVVSPGISATLLDRAEVVSAEIVPLVSDGKGVGAIVLGARRTDVASEDSVAFARAIGNQIVQSIELETSFRRVAESEQRYRALMEGANDAISIQTSDGVIREANRRLEKALDLPKERIVGHHIGEFVTAKREPSSPVEIRKANGPSLLMEFSDTAVEVGGEKLVFSIARDVTEQVRAQAHLMVSDRMASVGLLAAGVAHEINNPLCAVTCNLELAARKLDATEQRLGSAARLGEVSDEIRDAREAAERVRVIVRDLMVFSRAEEDRRGPVDLHRVLDSSLRMAWSEIRHRARVVKDYGRAPFVRANESRLGQVFLNLVVNAAQAIPEGHADVNEIRLRTGERASDGAAIVEVADTGPGIPADTLQKLFTPFFTTKPQGIGTGLGLTICQRIVIGLHGEITVSSEVGRGTVFRVVIPAADLEEEEPRPVPAPIVSSGRKGRILVIDDDEKVAMAVRHVLLPEHEVRVLTSAPQALELISSGERYDVILCDVMMPVMTGMELHAELTRTAPDQADRIVFVTGGAFTPRARAFLDDVPNPRLDKPFRVESLHALVNQRLA